MTALSADRKTPIRDPHFRRFDIAAGKKCFKGGLAVVDTSGNVEPGTAATGKKAVGRFIETVDNSDGSAGDKQIDVEQGVFRWSNSTGGDEITKADVESVCYIVDDQTVAKTDNGDTRSEAGKIFDVDDDGVWVETFVDPDITPGSYRQQVGPFVVTTAADESDTDVPIGGEASAPGFVAQRGGSIVGWSAALSAAATGAGQNIRVEVAVNGTPIEDTELEFTQSGGETELQDTRAAGTHTYSAGDLITAVYSSDTITNTPVLSATVEVQQ